MTRRSRAREVALQMLYQRDLNPHMRRPALERFARDRLGEEPLAAFALGLYDGVVEHRADLDARISAVAANWRLSRMACVDRNVIRLGAYEVLHSADTPAGVAINEAIEIARRYGSADSPAFVNGILDQVRKAASPGEKANS